MYPFPNKFHIFILTEVNSLADSDVAFFWSNNDVSVNSLCVVIFIVKRDLISHRFRRRDNLKTNRNYETKIIYAECSGLKNFLDILEIKNIYCIRNKTVQNILYTNLYPLTVV